MACLGLTARGCELLLEAVDGYSEDWLRQTFGDVFFDRVEAVYIEQMREMLPPFLPCLSLTLSSDI